MQPINLRDRPDCPNEGNYHSRRPFSPVKYAVGIKLFNRSYLRRVSTIQGGILNVWRFRASTDSQVAEHTNEHENLVLACMFAHSAKSKPANEMKFL